MAATRLDIVREIEETYPIGLRFPLSAQQAAALGYGTLDEAAAAIAAATVHLRIASPATTIAATVSVALTPGLDAMVSMSFAAPTSITDTVQTCVYWVVLEPGSTTSERTIVEGSITISARPAA